MKSLLDMYGEKHQEYKEVLFFPQINLAMMMFNPVKTVLTFGFTLHNYICISIIHYKMVSLLLKV